MSAVAKQRLKAPFPAFGGKSTVAPLVWSRLGNPRNYIEPFAFSAATLLLRPDEPQIETINDLNAYVANFWRAVRADPEAVAAHADWPVNETDLHARHRWLVRSEEANDDLRKVRENPDAYDARIAGWWCWGACMWIGSGWCEERGVGWKQIPELEHDRGVRGVQQRPNLDRGLIGQSRPSEKLPFIGDRTAFGRGCLSGQKMREPSGKRPCMTNNGGGQGVTTLNGHNVALQNRPQLADAYSRGRGVHGNDVLTDCERRRLWLIDWMTRLSDRLRPVRVCCGHWMRVCDSDSTLTRLGLTGVLLDPPYRKRLADGTENRAAHIYANDKAQDVDALCDEVQVWCLKWGGNPEIRIALCGLEGEYPALDAEGWDKVPWKSRGGYGNRTDRGKENAARERIWFSPACLRPTVETHLFSEPPCPSP